MPSGLQLLCSQLLFSSCLLVLSPRLSVPPGGGPCPLKDVQASKVASLSFGSVMLEDFWSLGSVSQRSLRVTGPLAPSLAPCFAYYSMSDSESPTRNGQCRCHGQARRHCHCHCHCRGLRPLVLTTGSQCSVPRPVVPTWYLKNSTRISEQVLSGLLSGSMPAGLGIEARALPAMTR